MLVRIEIDDHDCSSHLNLTTRNIQFEGTYRVKGVLNVFSSCGDLFSQTRHLAQHPVSRIQNNREERVRGEGLVNYVQV